jgi:hypothetical protein
MRVFAEAIGRSGGPSGATPSQWADHALEEFDKRFPPRKDDPAPPRPLPSEPFVKG